ncbi:MAG: hypothetical protein IJ815_01690 [Lachnospiraceae bacterium]|nr:hypothetical protein [Lachnospiraceae bacterium]
MENKNIVNNFSAEITEKRPAGEKSRLTAYMQGFKKIERKAQAAKGGKKA